jgi:hypothetical protein
LAVQDPVKKLPFGQRVRVCQTHGGYPLDGVR